MPNRFRKEFGLIFTWLLFPLVPVVLEDTYYAISVINFNGAARSGPDPHDWSWLHWVIMLGPLLGFGFLAGATVSLPDVPAVPRRHLRNLLARRGVWVAIGPWWGALVCTAVFFGWAYLWPAATPWNPQLPKSWEGTWASTIFAWELAALFWIFITLLAGFWAYSWLWPAFAALGRAARIGQWKQTFLRGFFVACAFVGSLFGGFWAATAAWRSYFFDARIVPLALLAMGLVVSSGCAGTITYGEMRRRELFHAMLVAWVLGLALMWRWWARARPRHPPGSPGESH